MAKRIWYNVERPKSVTLSVDGLETKSFTDETLAALLLTLGKQGSAWSLFCNMGACYACMVMVAQNADRPFSSVPACMTRVKEGLIVKTGNAP